MPLFLRIVEERFRLIFFPSLDLLVSRVTDSCMANSLGWSRAEWQTKKSELLVFGIGHIIGWLISAVIGLLLIYPQAFQSAAALGVIVAAAFVFPIYVGTFLMVRMAFLKWLPRVARPARQIGTLIITLVISAIALFCLGWSFQYLYFDLFPRLFV